MCRVISLYVQFFLCATKCNTKWANSCMHSVHVCVCLPTLQSGQQRRSVNHQQTKEVVCPIDSEKGLFIPPEFILVTSASELRLDLFPLRATDLTSQLKRLNFGSRRKLKIVLTDVLLHFLLLLCSGTLISGRFMVFYSRTNRSTGA